MAWAVWGEDEAGNIYLTYGEDPSGSSQLHVLRRDATAANWSSSNPEPIEVEGTPATYSIDTGHPPAIAVDSQNNLLYVDGYVSDRNQSSPTWQVSNVSSRSHDLVLRQDKPYAVATYEHEGIALVSDNYGRQISDLDLEAYHPAIALHQDKTVVVVWDGCWYGAECGLFSSRHNPDVYGQVKHYYLNPLLKTGRIATRLDEDLYYALSDPTGQAIVFTDSSGAEAGHVFYDPFGQLHQDTLPFELLDLLRNPLDEVAYLRYDGQRWYDPGFGLYVQPGGGGRLPYNATGVKSVWGYAGGPAEGG